ncbi:MAG: GTP 3',8-cyclase MoaA [Crocinitomicaceae bacterium]
MIDKYGRKHDYLRISLLERCNLRCTYCMPEEGIQLRDKSEFMSEEELLQIVSVFVDFGIKKIRLTGGEPLIKKNFSSILKNLSEFPVELTMTTNGILLDRYIEDLQKAGMKKLNISIDSLEENRFNAITRRKDFKRIIKNIDLAHAAGFDIKLNVVLMKNINEDEIVDFVEMTGKERMHLRFIEFMPFDGNKWDWSKKVTEQEILSKVNNHFKSEHVIALPSPPNSTSRNFKVDSFKSTFGIISTLTNPFCDTCNRIRLTADGKIKNCLFSNNEGDILGALRAGKDIRSLIRQSILEKHEKRAGIKTFQTEGDAEIFKANRSMTTIGG